MLWLWLLRGLVCGAIRVLALFGWGRVMGLDAESWVSATVDNEIFLCIMRACIGSVVLVNDGEVDCCICV